MPKKFICLKYEQVEDGAVEGHPTMIWGQLFCASPRHLAPILRKPWSPLRRSCKTRLASCMCTRAELGASARGDPAIVARRAGFRSAFGQRQWDRCPHL